MTKEKEGVFNKLSGIDISQMRQKKGKFDYLSWALAHRELKKVYPNATFEVHKTDGKPYIATETGYFVEVSVTVEGITHTQFHPVLDNMNRPIAKPNCFHINTSIQRALAKAVALHGLGISLYAGEDLEQYDQTPEQYNQATLNQQQSTPNQQQSSPSPYNNNYGDKMASPKQIALLDKNNVEFDANTLTSKQASDMIKAIINGEPVPKQPIMEQKNNTPTFSFDETATNTVTLESVLSFIQNTPSNQLQNSEELEVMLNLKQNLK
jgi:hypothetical protein